MVFHIGTIMLYIMAWFLRLHSNLRNLSVKQDAFTLPSPLRLGTWKTHLNRSGLTLCLTSRLPRLILPFQRAGAIQVVRTRTRDKSPSHILVIEHFWTTDLDNTWCRQGGPPKKDRLLICKHCSWPSRDSARYGSTSNLLVHLQNKHRIKSGADSIFLPAVEGSLDRFLESPRKKTDVEEMLVRWVIQTRQPFTVVEHPAFRALIEATGATLPIKTADTLFNRIKEEFYSRRASVKEVLARSSQTLALSLDVWTSENQIPIMGIIGYWISPEFDKRDELLEFAEINGPHSGENLADVVLKMLDELDIAPKLLIITGDNAVNNGTLCDSLHDQLLKRYNNDDDRFRIRPLMRFRGRQSFIPCLAHILNLICGDVLASLRAGSARETKAILDDMAIHSRAAFNFFHSTKKAIMKVRLLTLWIVCSPQRRQDWKEVSPGK